MGILDVKELTAGIMKSGVNMGYCSWRRGDISDISITTVSMLYDTVLYDNHKIGVGTLLGY